jgi:hypothetical protein
LLCSPANGTFLRRRDFTSRFITIATSISDGITPMAAIDWGAATTALHSGELPCSGGERRILQLSASLAGGIPVDLRDAVTGLDDRNTALLITAIQQASGNYSLPDDRSRLRYSSSPIGTSEFPATSAGRSCVIGAGIAPPHVFHPGMK